ncbi:MAG: histidine kinase [Galbitalea sp.]
MQRNWLRRVLTVLGVLAVAWSGSLQFFSGPLATWALVCMLVADAAWLVFAVFPFDVPGLRIGCLCLMVGAGGISVAATTGVSLVPVAVAIIWLGRDIRRSLGYAAGVGLVAMVLVLCGDVLAPVTPLGLVSIEAGLVVAFLAGQSRRQYLLVDARSRELVQEQARTDVLAARQQIAHDIHDVLAHSLGGLVIQLDAVDALLDSGEVAAAAAKVRDARTLAVDGLGEARRAVTALREPGADSGVVVAGDQVFEDVDALLEAHRSLSGSARLTETGTRTSVSEALELALRRAVQEGLTNARKHAPGAPVTVALRWGGDGVDVEISNPVTGSSRAGASVSTGGHGLVGMRERFAALPGGAVSSGIRAGRFVVTVRAKTA